MAARQAKVLKKPKKTVGGVSGPTPPGTPRPSADSAAQLAEDSSSSSSSPGLHSSGSSKMKIDGFLKVPDIPGPSERDGHEEEIEIHGVHYSMQAPHDPNSLSRRGRVALSMITFTKHYDMASPYLQKALFENTLFDEIVCSLRRTIEGETSDYLVITFTDASVMTYEVAPSAEDPDLLEETVGFAYKTITFNYDDSHEIEMSVATGM